MRSQPDSASCGVRSSNSLISVRSGVERMTAFTTDRPNIVSGLLEMHREIAGAVEHHGKVTAALVFDLEAMEHTIRLRDADAQLGRAKPVPAGPATFKREMRRDVLAALRSSVEPVTSLQIARSIIAARALPDRAKEVVVMRKRVGLSRSWPQSA